MQKKCLSTVLVLMGLIIASPSHVGAANSPIDRGSYIVGGAAMMSSMSGDLYESGGDGVKMIMLAPSLSGFVAPGLAIGGQLLIANLSQGGNSLTIFGIGPRASYYFGSASAKEQVRGRSYPYLTASYIYGQVTDDSGLINNGEYTLNAISFGGGLSYMLTNSVGLIAEVNFRSDSVADESDNSLKGTSFNVILGFSMFVW